MRYDQITNDTQAQAHALWKSVFRTPAVERSKDIRLFIEGDTRPGIIYSNPDLVISNASIHRHGPA